MKVEFADKFDLFLRIDGGVFGAELLIARQVLRSPLAFLGLVCYRRGLHGYRRTSLGIGRR